MPETVSESLAGRTIRCLLFDFGDTLWSRRDLEQWRRMENASNARAAVLLRDIAGDRWPALSDEVLGRQLHEAIDDQMRFLIRRQPYTEPNGGAVVAEVLRIWQIAPISQEQGAAIFEALRVHIIHSRPLFEDVLPTLAELRQRGFLLGAVSNRHWGGPIFQDDLEQLGLLRYIDPCYIAISADHGIRKPHPALFHRPLHAMGVPPSQAAMVGDSLLTDVAGSKHVGIFSVWKPKPGMREQAAARAETSAAAPPSGLHVTDDDYILARVRGEHHDGSTAKPDVIIDHIGDLLGIFVKAGEKVGQR